MAAIDWPADLPARPDHINAEQTLGGGTLRPDIKIGKPQAWQKSTATPDRAKAVLILSATQAASFDEFFCITTRFGCFRFNWADVLGRVAEVRFLDAPILSVASGETYRAEFGYEVLP